MELIIMSLTTIITNRKRYIIDQLGSDYIDAGSYEIRYKCPFCKELGKHYDDYKLYVNYKSGFYYCQRCQAKGRITLDLLLDVESNATSAKEAMRKLLEVLSVGVYTDDADDDSEYYLIPKNKPVPNTLAYEYITNRGITPEDIDFYSIRVASIHDPPNYQGRIIIPNRVISHRWTDQYVARDYIGSKVRYLNPRNNKSHQIVFNIHRIPKYIDKLIINEGVINSIIAGTNSVATFGKYVSTTQLSKILSVKPRSIYISLDTDARELALKLCDKIVSISDAKVYLVDLPDDLDASDLGKDKYLDIVNSSKEYNSRGIYVIENYLFKH